MLAADAYGKLKGADLIKAQFQLGNTFLLQNEIKQGYKAFIESQERNHHAQIEAVNRQIGAIHSLSSTIDARFSALGAQVQITNSILKSIEQFIALPEFEKERKFFFSEGVRYLKLAAGNVMYYTQALESFLKAYEMNDNDYLVSYHFALIYLHSSENLNLEEADKFLKITYRLSKGIDDKVFKDSCYQLKEEYTNIFKDIEELFKNKNYFECEELLKKESHSFEYEANETYDTNQERKKQIRTNNIKILCWVDVFIFCVYYGLLPIIKVLTQ